MVDTGASYSCSPFKSDFTSFHTLDTPKNLTATSSGCMIQGEGTVKYMVMRNNGSSQIIQMTALYVPQLKRRLVSPQGIETQEGNPVFFGFSGRRNGVNPY